MAYMYILECDDGTFYTGSTVVIVKRIEQHDAGEGALLMLQIKYPA